MLSAQYELTHTERQHDLTCVKGQNLNFETNFVFFFLRLVTLVGIPNGAYKGCCYGLELWWWYDVLEGGFLECVAGTVLLLTGASPCYSVVRMLFSPSAVYLVFGLLSWQFAHQFLVVLVHSGVALFCCCSFLVWFRYEAGVCLRLW